MTQIISFNLEILGKQQTLKTLASLEIALQKISTERKRLTSEFKSGSISEKQYEAGLTKIITGSKQLKTQKAALNNTLRAEQKELNVNRGSMAALRIETAKLAKQVDNFAVGVNGTETELKQLKSQLISNRTAVSQYDKTLNSSKGNLSGYSKGLMGVGSSFQKLGLAMGIGIGFQAIKSGFGAIIGISKDFEAQVSKSFSLLVDLTDEQGRKLKDLAVELGSSTEFTATQSAEAIEFLAMAGYNADQIMQALPATLALASAGSLELGQAADIASNILSGFRLEASETQRVVDTSAYTAANFNTNIIEMGEAMKYLAPISAALKIPIEEASTVVGALANNGLKGGEATRSLTSAFGRLAKPTRAMNIAMKKLNVDFFDADGQFVGIANTVGILENKFVGMTDKQKIANIQTIFGAQATKQITSLLGFQKEAMIDGEAVTLKGAEALRFFTKETENAGGTAQKMSEVRMDNLQGDLLKLQSAIEGAAIKFLESSQGGFRAFTQFLTQAVPVLQDNLGLIGKITAFLALYIARQKIASKWTIISTAAQKGYAFASKILSGQISLTAMAQRGLNTTMRANPIGLIVTIIAALVLILWELYQRNEKVRVAFDKVFAVLKVGFDYAKQALMGFVSVLVTVFKTGVRVFNAIVDVVSLVGRGIFNLLKQIPMIGRIFSALQSIAKGVASVISTVFGYIPAIFAGIVAEAKELINNINRYFEDIALRAEIISKQIQKGLSIKSDTKAKLQKEIDDLRKGRKKLAAEGKAFGEAFNEAYDKAMAGGETKKEIKVSVAKTKNGKGDPTGDPNGDPAGDIPTFADNGKGAASKAKAEAEAKAAEIEKARLEAEKLQQEADAKAKADKEKLQDDIIKIQQNALKAELDNLQDGIDKERAILENSYSLELTDLESQIIDKANLSELEIEKNNAINRLIEAKKIEHTAKLTALDKKYNDESLAGRIDAIQENADKEAAILEATITDTEILEKKKQELALETARQKFQLLEKEAMASEIVTQSQLDQLRLLASEIETLSKGESPEFTFESLVGKVFGVNEEMSQAITDSTGQLASDVYGFLTEKKDQQIQDELDSTIAGATERTTVRLDALQKEKDEGLITEAEYNVQKAAAEKGLEIQKQRAEERAFELNKKAQKSRLIIEALVAGIKLWVSPGFPAAIPMTIALAANTGLGLAKINSQQFPQAARGRMVTGKRHSNGGEIVELEDGEVVLNRKTIASNDVFNLTGTPLQISDALNRYNNNGDAFLKSNQIKLSTKTPTYENGFGGKLPTFQPGQSGSPLNVIQTITSEDFERFANMVTSKINSQKTVLPVRELNKVQNELTNTQNISTWSK